MLDNRGKENEKKEDGLISCKMDGIESDLQVHYTKSKSLHVFEGNKHKVAKAFLKKFRSDCTEILQ